MSNKTYTPSHQNEASILLSIINNKHISRAELSKNTGLSKSSISDITKSLLHKGIIIEEHIGKPGEIGGRPPIYLSFNYKCAYAVSIDVGKDYIYSMLSGLDGMVIDSWLDKNLVINKETIIAYLTTHINQLMQIVPNSYFNLIGIAIAINGTVSDNRITFTPYSNIDQVDVKQSLEAVFDYPIYLINEANAGAIGEYTYSSPAEHLINISIDDGIGAGIIENGALWLGHNGNAGEIGHSILFPDGKQCPCGNKGCLEQYASNRVLFENMALAKISRYERLDATGWHPMTPEIKQKLIQNAIFLSIGINNIIAAYDPDVVVIDNNLYRQFPFLIDVIQENLVGKHSRNATIRNTDLDGLSILLGGVALVFQIFFKNNNIKISSSPAVNHH